MDLLPWILLLLGAALLGGIYWFGKRRERRRPGSLLHDADLSAKEDLGQALRGDVDPLSDDLDELNRMINQRFEPAPLADSDPALVDSAAPAPRTIDRDEPVSDRAPEPRSPAPEREPPAAAPASRVAPKAPTRPTSPPVEPELILALHIAAPRGRDFRGPELQRLFESRNYRYGDFDIFHSLHQGMPVFSIANMVKPGSFDLAGMETFRTPGISLFMQLPGPHTPTAAFDVLLSEARALAEALGGTLLDSERSTLTQQTIQHLRERMVEFQSRSAKASRR